MKRCNYIILAIIAIMVIIAIVMVASGGITGRVVAPSPCADIGIPGYDVLPEYLAEFESKGYRCFEGPREDAFCCVK